MEQVVIDTNVVVSSVLSSKGNPAKIMKLCLNDLIKIVLSNEILDEYKRVLSYNRLNIAIETQSGIIRAIEEVATIVEPTKSTISFADESDRVFYDTAKASNSILITGNVKHFPNESFIMTPSEFFRSIIGELET